MGKTITPENGKIIGLEIKPKFVLVNFTSNEVEAGEITPKEYTVKVHRAASDQLVTALNILLGHAVFFCGLDNGKIGEKEIKNRKIIDMPAFRDYEFKGFSLKGDDEDEKLIIKMTKKAKNDSEFPINVPGIGIADGTYLYDEILAEDLDSVIIEVRSFIEGKNYYVQGSLDFSEKESEQTEEVENPYDDI